MGGGQVRSRDFVRVGAPETAKYNNAVLSGDWEWAMSTYS
jgi:hypothetical protein